MIKIHSREVDGKTRQFCATLTNGPSGHRAIISEPESANSLVVIDAQGLVETLESRLMRPESFLDRAVERAFDSGLVARALASGEVQNGTLNG